jgi:hypothetical protein
MSVRDVYDGIYDLLAPGMPLSLRAGRDLRSLPGPR